MMTFLAPAVIDAFAAASAFCRDVGILLLVYALKFANQTELNGEQRIQVGVDRIRRHS